jgi:hypothetical protein
MATAKTPAKTTEFEIPSSLAAAADLFYKTREERLALQKEVNAIEEREKILKDHLVRSIPKSEATGIAGKLVRVSVVTKSVPQVEDWDAFYAYIVKTRKKGGFALLNKAVNSASVKEIWDAGKDVPGVTPFNKVELSVNKL